MANTKPNTERDANNGLLPRTHIVEVQRARLISAMCSVACERGAANATVADVVGRSGVSRRTFYELFSSGEECLLAAIDQALSCACEYVSASHDPAAPWPARMRAGVEAFLWFVEDQPAMGRLLVVESLAAGTRALERRALALAPIIREVDAGRTLSRAPAGLTPLSAEGAIGAVLSVLHARLLEQQQASLLELSPQLAAMILLPYLGGAAARRELDRPALARPSRSVPPPGVDDLSGLPMRLTYRTVRVLRALAEHPGASNRRIGQAAGITDQGQASKLLRRLQRIGMVENHGAREVKGAPNQWALTSRGHAVEQATRGRSSPDA